MTNIISLGPSNKFTMMLDKPLNKTNAYLKVQLSYLLVVKAKTTLKLLIATLSYMITQH